MLRMITAYECTECGDVLTKSEATEAGPLVQCECGEQYERGALGNCPHCYQRDKAFKVISKLGCGNGCCVGVTPVRVLRINERRPFDGTWRETDEGLFVRVTPGDLRRMAKEVDKPDA